MKKLEVIVQDKHTLLLNEDGQKGDIINLAELTNVDLTAIEEIIESGKDQVYEKKLKELRLSLEQERKQALEILRLELTKNHSEKVAELEETISTFDVNKTLEIEKINSSYILEIEKLKQLLAKNEEVSKQVLQTQKVSLEKEHASALSKIQKELQTELEQKTQQIEVLLATQAKAIENEKLLIEQKYANEIVELKKQLAELLSNNKIAMIEQESKYEETISRLKLEHSEEINKKNEIISQKEMLYNELQNRKSLLSVKMIGEGLETWCHTEMTSYMQNGFFNCRWIKDNKAVKGEDETSGTKADFIFNIYATPELKEEELLTSVCLEMKDENPNSTHKKKNADYLKTLHTNRVKKNCKYAILVSNLELDNPNDLPIVKVRDYEDMYIVRPAYMIVLLNMITSLTTNFKDLLLEAHKEELEIKAKTDLLAEFEALKKTYLEKELESLEKQVNTIRKKSADIVKAAEEIDNVCETIINGYISKIQAKLDTFQSKITKEYKKFEKKQN